MKLALHFRNSTFSSPNDSKNLPLTTGCPEAVSGSRMDSLLAIEEKNNPRVSRAAFLVRVFCWKSRRRTYNF